MIETILPHEYMPAHTHGIYGKRWEAPTKITIHHTGCVADAESIAKAFQQDDRWASANYVIGRYGKIIMCVPEDYAAGTSDSKDNDYKAITIEVCNDGGAPDWKISAEAEEALMKLCADICRRHNIKLVYTGDETGTLTTHIMFTATACPGKYILGKLSDYAEEINFRCKYDTDGDYDIKLVDAINALKSARDGTGYTVGDAIAILKYLVR